MLAREAWTAVQRAPEQQVDAVLPEEGLALEDQGRHAPVAGRLEVLGVLFEHGVEVLGVGLDGLVELGQVEASAGRGLGQMRPFVPALHPTTPDHLGDLVDEDEPPAALRRGHPQA